MTEQTETRTGAAVLDLLLTSRRTIDLAQPLFRGVPQSPLHPSFHHVLSRRHGDLNRPDGSSGAADMIVTGCHVGTHIDALAHISHAGRLHGGVDAEEAQRSGRFAVQGAEHIPIIVTRGILLDIPATLGIDRCEPQHEVSVEELELALDRTGTVPRPGDVLLVRTGWASIFDDRAAYEGDSTGTPGPGRAGAEWLAAFGPVAVGGDTIAFETVPPASDAVPDLPAHRVLIVDHGIHIIELLDLEELSATEAHEFLFVLTPLKIVGATGSPARPIAIVDAAG